MEATTQKPMDAYFSMFNGHTNDAFRKAEAAFVGLFGQDVWDREIRPIQEAGIMAVFHRAPTIRTMAYVAMVYAYVNEPAFAGE